MHRHTRVLYIHIRPDVNKPCIPGCEKYGKKNNAPVYPLTAQHVTRIYICMCVCISIYPAVAPRRLRFTTLGPNFRRKLLLADIYTPLLHLTRAFTKYKVRVYIYIYIYIYVIAIIIVTIIIMTRRVDIALPSSLI